MPAFSRQPDDDGAFSPFYVPAWVVAAVLVGVMGCSPHHSNIEAGREAVLAVVPEAFSNGDGGSAGGEAVRLTTPMRWWAAFHDPGLDRAVAMAFDGNPSLSAAVARVRAARAVARREGAALFPSVDGIASAGNTTRETPDDPRGDLSDDDFRLGVRASYEVDVWGRIDALRDAARFEAVATAYDAQSVALSLAADVVTAWFQLGEALAQEDLLREQIDTNAQVLELIELRFRQGQVAAADVLRQRQLLEATRGQLDAQQGQTAVLRHRLNVLMGLPPEARANPVAADVNPSAEWALDPGDPLEVLRRRPDVRRAWAEVVSADRLVAAAVADRYPRIELSGSYVYRAERLRNVLDNWIATVAADLILPLIDGGRREAEVARARARTVEALALYKDAVLTALQEVEDALARERAQGALLQSLERQLEISDDLIERTRERYAAGQFDYLRVLDALASRQALQRDVLRERRELLGFRVDLYRSVAGPMGVVVGVGDE